MIFQKSLLQKRRIRKLPIGKSCLKVKSLISGSANSAFKNFYQIGECSIELETLLEFFVFIMVSVLKKLSEKIQSIVLGDQVLGILISDEFLDMDNCTQKISRIFDAFLDQSDEMIQEMSEDLFEALKLRFLAKISEDSAKLDLKFDRNWREISSGDHLFKRHEMKIKYLRSVDKSDLLSFFLTHFKEEVRELSVLVIGQAGSSDAKKSELELEIIDGEAEDGTNMITDIAEFKDSLEIYPLPLPQPKVKRNIFDWTYLLMNIIFALLAFITAITNFSIGIVGSLILTLLCCSLMIICTNI